MLAEANCDHKLALVGSKDRCPYCGQWHLVPGYCQALAPGYDPSSNPCLKYVTKAPPETLRQVETLSPVETDNRASDETLTETLSSDETLRTCEVCRKRFTPLRATARYCSPACRLKAHRMSGP
jgi:hypothetical protein